MTHRNKFHHLYLYTIKTSLLFAALFFLLGITNCASRPKTEYSTFKTRITDTGLKHFIVTIPVKAIRISNRSHQQTAPKKDLDERREAKIKKQLHKITEIKINSNQFCSTGYWIIETSPLAYTYGRQPYLRGECNELASATDIKSFPNQFTYW